MIYCKALLIIIIIIIAIIIIIIIIIIVVVIIIIIRCFSQLNNLSVKEGECGSFACASRPVGQTGFLPISMGGIRCCWTIKLNIIERHKSLDNFCYLLCTLP